MSWTMVRWYKDFVEIFTIIGANTAVGEFRNIEISKTGGGIILWVNLEVLVGIMRRAHVCEYLVKSWDNFGEERNWPFYPTISDSFWNCGAWDRSHVQIPCLKIYCSPKLSLFPFLLVFFFCSKWKIFSIFLLGVPLSGLPKVRDLGSNSPGPP